MPQHKPFPVGYITCSLGKWSWQSLWHPGTKAKHWAEELTPGQVKSCPNSWVFTTARAQERHLGWGGWLQPLLLSCCRLRAGSTLQGRWNRAGCCS